MSRRRRATRKAPVDDGFWGKADVEVAPPTPIVPTSDPRALLRSLGDPPLAPDPATAAGHLGVVYEEAVKTATALAAANGLLDPELFGDH
jgi:hypothetical protein